MKWYIKLTDLSELYIFLEWLDKTRNTGGYYRTNNQLYQGSCFIFEEEKFLNTISDIKDYPHFYQYEELNFEDFKLKYLL